MEDLKPMMSCLIYIFIVLLSGAAVVATGPVPEVTTSGPETFHASTSDDDSPRSERITTDVDTRFMQDEILSAMSPTNSMVRREAKSESENATDPVNSTPGREKEKDTTEGTLFWDIFLHPWSRLGRVTREVSENTGKEGFVSSSRGTVEEDSPAVDNENKRIQIPASVKAPILFMPGADVFRVERHTEDSKDDLESAEQRLGVGYFYSLPQPFYRPQFGPYRRRFFNRYLRYPIFPGK